MYYDDIEWSKVDSYQLHLNIDFSDDPDKMNQKLEEQFERGLKHKLKSGYKGHLGLGFQVNIGF